MPRVLIILLALALIASCKSQKTQNGNTETKEDVNERKNVSYNIQPEIIKGTFQPDQHQLNFQIAKAELVNSDLSVSVKYGGGCKAHEFKLVYAQRSESDTLHFHLRHLTTDDRCKAYVINEMQFDLSGIPLESTSIVLINSHAVHRK